MKVFSTLQKIAIISFLVVIGAAFKTSVPNASFYKDLRKYTSTLPAEFSQISAERKTELLGIGNYVIEKELAQKSCKLLFICTSNSRRSHMAQIWAQTASVYYGVDSVLTFSGGTEATKVHPNTLAALKRCGFSITSNQVSENPAYLVNAGDKVSIGYIFSKKYNSSVNPKSNFLAAMVCSDADKSCPNVDGAELRLALPYDDPKYYDNTPSQEQKYDERCRQIAREMFFMMDYVKQKLILRQENSR